MAIVQTNYFQNKTRNRTTRRWPKPREEEAGKIPRVDN